MGTRGGRLVLRDRWPSLEWCQGDRASVLSARVNSAFRPVLFDSVRAEQLTGQEASPEAAQFHTALERII